MFNAYSPIDVLRMLGTCAITILVTYGVVKGDRWRWLTLIVICVAVLFLFPVGTVIGAIGLITVPRAKALFSADRVSYIDVKSEYKYRRRNRIE